jgi:hypothetical protein
MGTINVENLRIGGKVVHGFLWGKWIGKRASSFAALADRMGGVAFPCFSVGSIHHWVICFGLEGDV